MSIPPGSATVLAIENDVTSRTTRIFSRAELSVVDQLIGDAADMLRAVAPGLDERLAAGSLSARLVASSIARIVLRAIESPVAMKSRSETAGPFSQSVTYADTVGELTVLPADLVGITAGVGVTESAAQLGTIRVGGRWDQPSPW